MSRSANLAAFAKAIDGSAPFNINGTLTVNNLITPDNLTVNSITANVITSTTNVVTFGTAVNVASNGMLSFGAVSANGSMGTNGQVLISNSTGTYWGSAGSNNGVIYTYGIILGRG